MDKGGIVTKRQESLVKYRVLQRAWQREEWGCVVVLEKAEVEGKWRRRRGPYV